MAIKNKNDETSRGFPVYARNQGGKNFQNITPPTGSLLKKLESSLWNLIETISTNLETGLITRTKTGESEQDKWLKGYASIIDGTWTETVRDPLNYDTDINQSGVADRIEGSPSSSGSQWGNSGVGGFVNVIPPEFRSGRAVMGGQVGGHIGGLIGGTDLLYPASTSDITWIGGMWGAPRRGHTHQGVDVFAPTNTPILAIAGGIVDKIVNTDSGTGGIRIRLKHITENGTVFYSYYMHNNWNGLDTDGTSLAVGDTVVQGQVIAGVGCTGNARGTPPHIHFQIHNSSNTPVPAEDYYPSWLERKQ